MNAKQLIEAAKEVLSSRDPDCSHIWNAHRSCQWCHRDRRDVYVDDIARHILSTVRQDDDEPVTRERLEADENWVMVDTGVYHWKDRYGVMTSYHVTLTQQYSSLLWSSTGVVVRKVKSMGHLRRLVAALGE